MAMMSARPALRVRRAQAGDLAAIAALLAALGYTAADEEQRASLLLQVLARSDMAIFLAGDRAMPGDGALGLIVVSQRPQLHLGGTLVSVDALAVLPEARGHGVGRRLLRRAAAYARLHQAVRIELHTTRARENYRRGFYPANGFREVDSALFRRDLAPIATDYGQCAPGRRDGEERG